MSVLVKVQCTSKKQSKNWDANHPVAHQIELQVVYDPNSVFHQLSGGTNLALNTVNDEAANQFEIGKNYDILISPSEEATA